VTLVESLYIASATENDDKTGSPVRKKPMYRVTTKHYSNEDKLESSQPNPHFIVMNTISICPQNHFKKIQRKVYDKELNALNTSWVHGFNSCLKYDLFSVKIIMSHEPKLYHEFVQQKEESLKAKIAKLKNNEH